MNSAAGEAVGEKFRFTVRLPPSNVRAMNLAAAFNDSAQAQAAKTALCWGEREISYAELRTQAQTVAGLVQSRFAVQPGDRVALWVKNCPEFVPAVFGILSAGGVVVPINNFFKPAEVAFILKDSGAEGVDRKSTRLNSSHT